MQIRWGEHQTAEPGLSIPRPAMGWLRWLAVVLICRRGERRMLSFALGAGYIGFTRCLSSFLALATGVAPMRRTLPLLVAELTIAFGIGTAAHVVANNHRHHWSSSTW